MVPAGYEEMNPNLNRLLPEKSGFPAAANIICGKTLSKRSGWWKAIVLVDAEFGGTHKQQLRLYAWQFDKKVNRWKQRQKFNFSGTKYVPRVISVLESFVGKSGIEAYEKIENSMTRTIEHLKQELEGSRLDTTRLQEMEKKVDEFEKLLDRKGTDEKSLQRFLHEHYWMFGPEYTKIYRETWAGMKSRNDFLLKKETGFHDILELKLPSDDLFVGSRKPKMSGVLKDAISQMAEYLHYYYVHYLSHKEETGFDILYPKGIIILGRTKESERVLLEYHKAILNKIEILTYDDVARRARQVIKTIKKSRRRIDSNR